MNPAFSSFSEKYFPTLHLVKFSATQFQLWDNYSIAWAKIEIQEEKVKIISIHQKSIQIAELDSINEEKNQFLEELSSLVTDFHTITISLLEKTQNDFLDRKKELEKQFRKGFSAKENESLQPVVQLLEEGGHSVYLLPKWI
ncbi:hypothetical protein, partial [Bernardetia sp.]|uniref:hypothetical protein n=1 Tax=Bernardetia sp. TaxID=1937974 RepID=UPI0025C5E181